jgi:hypothetical protein
MPPILQTTNYTEYLTDGLVLQVTFTTFLGKLRSFSVVLIKDDGTNVYDISRYDTAHGAAHRDLLGRKTGSVSQGKVPLPYMPLEDALKYAKQDYKTNYARYEQYYEGH